LNFSSYIEHVLYCYQTTLQCLRNIKLTNQFNKILIETKVNKLEISTGIICGKV